MDHTNFKSFSCWYPLGPSCRFRSRKWYQVSRFCWRYVHSTFSKIYIQPSLKHFDCLESNLWIRSPAPPVLSPSLFSACTYIYIIQSMLPSFSVRATGNLCYYFYIFCILQFGMQNFLSFNWKNDYKTTSQHLFHKLKFPLWLFAICQMRLLRSIPFSRVFCFSGSFPFLASIELAWKFIDLFCLTSLDCSLHAICLL